MIKNNEASICSMCKGACCKGGSGFAIPSDFDHEITADFLETILKTGNWAIDWWDGEIRENIEFDDPNQMGQCYAIRPAHTNDESVFSPSWGGVCVLWSLEKGCSLPYKNRPLECRSLKPKEKMEMHCIPDKKYNKQYAIMQWLPYQKTIVEAGNRVRDRWKPSKRDN
jgi:Fe-S-cluster containining protein